MDFVVKFVAANVSSSVLKTLLYGKIVYSITFFNQLLAKGTKVALNTTTMIDC